MSPANTEKLAADGVIEHGPDRLLSGCRGDGQRPAGVRGRGGDPGDPRPSGQLAVGDDRLVARGLAPVPVREHRGLTVGVGGETVVGDEVVGEQRRHPLLAAADLELLGVVVHRPVHRQPELRERVVEGGAVPVTLGVGEDPVAVEDQRRHREAH
jgi:hypothetical protein